MTSTAICFVVFCLMILGVCCIVYLGNRLSDEANKYMDRLERRVTFLEASLLHICQVDDAELWESGHTGKMNEMARIAREALNIKHI